MEINILFYSILYILVPLPVHFAVFWQKVESSMPLLSTKTPSNHQTCQVLDSLQNKLVFVSVHRLSPPDCHRPGVYQAESRFVTEHDIPPVRGAPSQILSRKGKPLLLYGIRQPGLLGSSPGGQAQLLLEPLLNGSDRNVSPAYGLVF